MNDEEEKRKKKGREGERKEIKKYVCFLVFCGKKKF